MGAGEARSFDPGIPEEALRRLERRLDAASAAAERLLAEAARSAGAARAAGESRSAGESWADEAGAGAVPPAGWQSPQDESAESGGDLEALIQLLRSLRDLIPAELQRRLVEALREVLEAIRALIDWYLERLEHRRREPPEVQDIPIL